MLTNDLSNLIKLEWTFGNVWQTNVLLTITNILLIIVIILLFLIYKNALKK